LGGALALSDLTVIQNPFQGGQGVGNAFDNITAFAGDATDEGFVYVAETNHIFTMTSYGNGGTNLGYTVTAQP